MAGPFFMNFGIFFLAVDFRSAHQTLFVVAGFAVCCHIRAKEDGKQWWVAGLELPWPTLPDFSWLPSLLLLTTSIWVGCNCCRLDQMGLSCLMPLDLKTPGKMRSLDDLLSSVD
ncbi:hypothetical protein ACLOJK_037043 [Asimina triloba]